jgi:hypothetical protein
MAEPHKGEPVGVTIAAYDIDDVKEVGVKLSDVARGIDVQPP